ncbi:MAG: hypothetical protein Q7R67_00220 [bacterium]|nr:hypothetical protein [bacterium]
MKQKFITATLALALVALATPAFALDTDYRDKNLGGRPVPVPAERVGVDVKARVEERKIEAENRKASSTERRVEIKANIETRKEEMKENREVRQASSTAKRVEMQRGLAKKKAEHTARLLMATVERLEKILTRIESRIEKVKAEGKNTAEAEGFVAEAKVHLSAAKTSIALFASVDLSGDKAQENFERVRNIAAEVKGHIREAHTSLMKALRSLGALGKTRVEANATSIVEVEDDD